jgi:parvulin-like peptidyl-prolyl isomerase
MTLWQNSAQWFFRTLLLVGSVFCSVSYAVPKEEAKAAAATQPIDAILVTVADEIILVSDFQRAVSMATESKTTLSGGGKLSGGTMTVDDANRVLEQLINQRVMTIKIRELGLQVTSDELSTEIESFLKRQNITPEKLQEQLNAEGESMENYREEFKRQLEMERLVGRMIRPTVSVTDDDVRSFYLQQPGIAEKQQRVKLRKLMIALSVDGAVVAERRANVAQVEREVRNTEPQTLDFERLVKLYSNDPDAIKGGALDPKELRELPAELRAKLTPDLKAGSVVGPLSIGGDIFFFQYLGSVLGDEKAFEKQKDHWRNMLLETKGKERLEEYLKAERTKTKIARKPFVVTR